MNKKEYDIVEISSVVVVAHIFIWREAQIILKYAYIEILSLERKLRMDDEEQPPHILSDQEIYKVEVSLFFVFLFSLLSLS